VTAWDELKPVLARLRDQQPGVLARYPSLDFDLVVRTPPVSVHLTSWAADAAEELHRQFGSDVELTVGFLPYPPDRPVPPVRRAPGQIPDPLDPREVTVALDGPAAVSSGHTLCHHLSVHNRVTAAVVDPQTGETVGGFPGARLLRLKVFRAIPGGSVRIPC
jgi:hypothetical protein